ncbi:tryptophan halogenase family protein [Sphingomonas sp. CFBP8993]|uniref:tryptophan halogenase family protein n=1 Tax=Sphingomonas sp. CFBP8993 TaxID=3096526 RepID=UPI002A6ADBCB|nr:tryptophan halogenase family protein [Sphingomonas sp. CFBP8993]MDY0957118.1 tryptophan halogenase family protein [Sphingomonas sp. CFBP8993]
MTEGKGKSILIVGGGTAGWLTAAYLARFLGDRPGVMITLLEAPEIGPIGVGEGAFPTIRNTLRFLGIDEGRFIRAAGATFKQGIRFDDWGHAPAAEWRHRYWHPFDPPFQADGVDLVAHWLAQDPATRRPFAEAVTIQHRVATAGRGPKSAGEGAFDGPLSYAYHFDAHRLVALLADHAVALGVRHLHGRMTGATVGEDGRIDHVMTDRQGVLTADLYVDCTGQRAELIEGVLGERLVSVRDQLFTNRALACRVPHDEEGVPALQTMTIATAHPGGWTWDIGLAEGRGIGTVYSDAHMGDDAALATLASYLGRDPETLEPRLLSFEPGYRRRPWIGNCVAIGLAGGFLEPLESTGIVLIEAAVAMLAELFPHHGPVAAPAARFNMLMTARYQTIVDFLKLHYCLSRRDEPFWRDNSEPGSISKRLRDLLEQWRYRPPGRFDFTLDVESFAYFNYQYILYGMGFADGDRTPAGSSGEAERLFRKLRLFGDRAVADLPSHGDLVAAMRG